MVRLVAEGQCRGLSSCATLTYSPKELPDHGSLRKLHIPAFIKRLRSRIEYRVNRGIDRKDPRYNPGPFFSYDVCGEYSPGLMRPHYHIALFGYWPDDYEAWAKSQSGNQEFVSKELTEAWGHGRVTFQLWSSAAASYCAGHQAWKLSGSKADELLRVLGPDGKVLARREPEFHDCSKRPGIGRSFMEKYGKLALQQGEFAVSGRLHALPAYFLRRGDKDHPELAAALRAQRAAFAVAADAELTDERRAVIERCNQLEIERGSRGKARF